MNINKLLDKCESMTLLCTKACFYWNIVKLCFSIPLVLTSSAMCIINSINQDANEMRVPNIVVNAISVLVMSLNNSIKPSEKFELFKKLSNQFMMLSQEIESYDCEVTIEKYNLMLLKYDNLIQECPFEDVPRKYKFEVAKLYNEIGRCIPIQLNGTIGNLGDLKKRNSKDNIAMLNNNIV